MSGIGRGSSPSDSNCSPISSSNESTSRFTTVFLWIILCYDLDQVDLISLADDGDGESLREVFVSLAPGWMIWKVLSFWRNSRKQFNYVRFNTKYGFSNNLDSFLRRWKTVFLSKTTWISKRTKRKAYANMFLRKQTVLAQDLKVACLKKLCE